VDACTKLLLAFLSREPFPPQMKSFPLFRFIYSPAKKANVFPWARKFLTSARQSLLFSFWGFFSRCGEMSP